MFDGVAVCCASQRVFKKFGARIEQIKDIEKCPGSIATEDGIESQAEIPRERICIAADAGETAAAFFNVAGNLLLMPDYGVWAAAWMTVATELVLATGLLAALFSVWRNRRTGGSTG